MIFLAVLNPLSFPLALVPILFVFPAMAWLDRIEPEPRASRAHAIAWGATVSILVALIANASVEAIASRTWAVVLSAPVAEEAMKGLGLVWAVKRREIDSPMDGLIFAGWIGLGFAVVEDITYFATAHQQGQLAMVFVTRALITPFAHPLFTAWTGLAIGRMVARGEKRFTTALWGYAIAVALHMGWNGSLTATQSTKNSTIIIVVALVYVAIFVATIVMCVKTRRKERDAILTTMPTVASKLGLPVSILLMFGEWKTLRSARAQTPRASRRSFDAMHASMARLAMLENRGNPDPVEVARHVETFRQAQTVLKI
jgi:protease PrsW